MLHPAKDVQHFLDVLAVSSLSTGRLPASAQFSRAIH